MTNTELSGGDAVLRVAVLEQQVAALEAEKARFREALQAAATSMWNSEANMDNEAADIEDVLAAPAPAERVERAVEPVATINESKGFSAEDASRLTRLPVGAKLYTSPPAPAVYQCPRCSTSMQVDEEAKPAPAAPDVAGLEGRVVSIDVSTGDHDAAHRLYGEVVEVAADGTLLCELSSNNHDYDVSPQWLIQAVKVLDAMPIESGHVHPSRALDMARGRVIHEARLFVMRLEGDKAKTPLCEYAGCCAHAVGETRLCEDHQEAALATFHREG